MKIKDAIVVILAILILIFVIYLATSSSPSTNKPVINNNYEETPMALNLKSSAFGNNENIPSKYTCDADGINPPLIIEGTDPNAKSLVLILDDPDAASVVGYTYDHWVKFNIDPSLTNIEEGKEPLGTAGKGSGNNLTYAGPCPPSGTHHYHFKLYSLDTKLTLAEGATKAEVEAAMQGHILQQAELIGLYQKINNQ